MRNDWLDKYEDGGEYLGTTNKGRNYSPAWGGQFEEGGVTSPQICYDPKTGKVVPCKPGAHKTWIFTENPAITASQFELNMNKTTRENAIKDNEFTKEAQDLKNYLIKNQPGEDIEIYPTYKSDKNDRVTTTNRGKTLNEILKGSDAKTRLAFMAHHGSNLFGSPAGNLGKKLQATTYDNCYLGSCYSGDIAASDEFKGLSNFNFRPGYVEYNSPDGKEGLPWFGVNPNKNSQTGEAGVNNAFFNGYGYGVTWNGERFVAVGNPGTHTIVFSNDGIIWYGVKDSISIFSDAGIGVAGNSKVGPVIVPSAIHLNNNINSNTLTFSSESYYQSGVNNISINVNSM